MIIMILIHLTLVEIKNFFHRLVSLFKSWIEALNWVSNSYFSHIGCLSLFLRETFFLNGYPEYFQNYKILWID